MPEYDEGNIFAKIIEGTLPCHKVYETEHVLAFMDIMPRGDGHVLVVPKAKARNLLDADPDDLTELIRAVQVVARATKQALNANGVTVQQFNETAGGQVVFHLHFHVIPRFDGIALKPHTGEMAKPETLAKFAAQIREALPE